MRALLAEARFAGLIRDRHNVLDNLDEVLAGTLDGFVAARLAGLEAVAQRPEAAELVQAQPVPVEVHELHIRFATPRVDAATIAVLNGAPERLRANGTVAALSQQATAPVLLRLAAATRWFNALDILGTVAFALSGVLIARRERYSLFGAFVLAVLPAVGGGVLRDLLLARCPIGILASPLPLLLVLGTVLTCFALYRLPSVMIAAVTATIDRRLRADGIVSVRNLYEVTDALGLAAFAVVSQSRCVRGPSPSGCGGRCTR